MEKRKNNANKCMRNLRENDTFIDNEQRTTNTTYEWPVFR